MNLTQWAIKWGVSAEALIELERGLGVRPTPGGTTDATTEAGASDRERLAICKHGGHLWRNNVGAGVLDGGSFVRFGLGNESKSENSRFKSSDFIGIQPVHITEAHIGLTIGRFVAREMKRPGWVYRGTTREKAQLAFILYVLSKGGDAAFSQGEGVYLDY